MAIEHDTITDPYIHEPKDISTANAGQIYVADGLGSGSWKYFPHSAFYYDNIGTGTGFAVSGSYVLVNPATTGDADPHDFTHNSAGRLTYTGTDDIDCNVTTSISFKHSTGAGIDCFFALYKNGVLIPGSRQVVEGNSANYANITVTAHVELSTNDYIEVYCMAASGTITVHAVSVQAAGVIV